MISEKKEREEASSSCSNTRHRLAEITGNDEGQRTLRMLVAKGALPHIGQFDRALRAGIDKPVTADRVELSRCNDLRQLLHVCRFDIHNVETLVLDVEVPQVDSEIVTADKGLAITVHGDAIYMVGVSIGVSPPRYSCNNCVVMCQARQLES